MPGGDGTGPAKSRPQSVRLQDGKLLTAQQETNDGSWFEAWFYRRIDLDIRNANSINVVEIRGSNQPSPADAVHAVKLVADVSVDGRVSITNPPRWVKARKVKSTGNPLSTDCYFAGVP